MREELIETIEQIQEELATLGEKREYVDFKKLTDPDLVELHEAFADQLERRQKFLINTICRDGMAKREKNLMDDMKLGKCCICEIENESVRNIMTLHKEIPAEEKNGGWGCFVCGLPARGAVAVLCDWCLDKYTGQDSVEIKFACLGYPGETGASRRKN